MRVGVPKEVKNNEFRVALTHSGLRSLVSAGHEVLIQEGAGVGSGISDELYASLGAKLVSSAQKAWDADIVIKVKEPQPEEFKFLRPNLYLFTYLHLANELEVTKALLDSKTRAIAYETIQLSDKSLPLLKPMSEVAGRMAPQVGASLLEKANGGSGVLLGGVTGVSRGMVTIIGGGVAGVNSAKIALGLGAEVTIVDINHSRLAYLEDIFGHQISTRISTFTNIEECVAKSDLVIGTVLIPGAKAPKLVTREMIKSMRPGSVVVDVAIDQGGCFETSKPTSHKSPTFVDENVVHYCVTNMPGAVSRTSTFALTNLTLRYLEKIVKDPVAAIKKDNSLKLGVNCWDGHCVYKQVSDDLGLPYKDITSLI